MPRAAAEEMPADDETVCSFCGMSHLMYADTKAKERKIDSHEDRIVTLEDHMHGLGLAVPPRADGSEVRSRTF